MIINRKYLKYLFFSHDGKLGDAVIHTALVAGIQSQDPDAKIDCTASGSSLVFWKNDNRIRKIFEIHSPKWLEAIKMGWQLRKNHYDFVIIWNKPKSEKIRLILKLINPTKLIVSEIAKGMHVLCREHQSLSMIFGKELKPSYSLPNRPNLKVNQPFILINLFGGVLESKRSIDSETAVKLITDIRKEFSESKIILCCENHTEEVAIRVAQNLAKDIALIEVKNLSSEGVDGLIALCASSSIIISPDTAIVHIASALDKPIIAIYQIGESKSTIWAPTSTQSKVIHSKEYDSIVGFNTSEVVEGLLEIKLRLNLDLY